jgi:hypothetical protein
VRVYAQHIGQFYTLNGTYHTQVVGTVHRFRCLLCGQGFSERTTSINFYTKKTLDYHELYRSLVFSESVSCLARRLKCSPASAQNRIDRFARNAIAVQARLTNSLLLREHLVADGFEAFDKSQFFPSNIDILVGQGSQFLYGATHVSLRRKGCMTPEQKVKRDIYDLSWKPKRGSQEKAFSELLSSINRYWDQERFPKLSLITDEHKLYPRVIKTSQFLNNAMKDKRLVHVRVSSKRKRTKHNPLFPVNYYDRELRKDIAAYHRETTCFGRSVSNGLLRFSIYQIWHNYEKKYRICWGKKKIGTHSDVAGVNPEHTEIEFSRIFSERAFLCQQSLSIEQKRIWLKEKITPLKDAPEYVQKFAQK